MHSSHHTVLSIGPKGAIDNLKGPLQPHDIVLDAILPRQHVERPAQRFLPNKVFHHQVKACPDRPLIQDREEY
jgi:hypothetical protein